MYESLSDSDSSKSDDNEIKGPKKRTECLLLVDQTSDEDNTQSPEAVDMSVKTSQPKASENVSEISIHVFTVNLSVFNVFVP